MRIEPVAGPLLCLALCTTAHAGGKMTGDQISALVSGNTTYGQHASKDRHGYTYNKLDGTFITQNHPDGRFIGTWEVKGDKFCKKPEGKKQYCHEVHGMGDGIYKRYGVSNKKHIATWTKVVPGNAEDLK